MKKLLSLFLSLVFALNVAGAPALAANSATTQYSYLETPEKAKKVKAVTVVMDTTSTDLTVLTPDSDKGVYLKSILVNELSAANLTIKSLSTSRTGTVSTLATTAFTVVAATDVATATAHGMASGQAVVFKTDTTLPAPLVAGTVYYAGNITANTFKIYTDAALTALVDITDTGTGTHSIDGTYVIGSGTAFTTDFTATAGLQEIVVNTGQTRTVSSVVSNTVLILTATATSSLTAKTFKRQRTLVTLELPASKDVIKPYTKDGFLLVTETGGALVFSTSVAISSMLVQLVEGQN